MMPTFYGLPKSPMLFGFVPYEDQDATGIFLKHYRQYLILDFMSKNSAEYTDRMQAIKELEQCERTLQRWKMHPNWDEHYVLLTVEELKKKSFAELIYETYMTEGEG